MFRSVLFLFVAAVLATTISCTKGSDGGGGGNPGGGSTLQVTLDPPVNSTQPATPDVDFNLKVTVTAGMPSQGVSIFVTARKDDGSGAAPFFQVTQNTSAAVTNIVITNTPLDVMCIVNVTVTSLNNASTSWTGSYRYSRK